MKKPSMMYTSSLTFSHFTHAIGFQSMAQSQTQRARCFQTCLIGFKKTQYVSIPITRPFPFFVPKLWVGATLLTSKPESASPCKLQKRLEFAKVNESSINIGS